jgi:hypothetical protein
MQRLDDVHIEKGNMATRETHNAPGLAVEEGGKSSSAATLLCGPAQHAHPQSPGGLPGYITSTERHASIH